MAWRDLLSPGRLVASRERPAAPDLRPMTLADGQTVAVRWVRDARARRLRLIVAERGVRLTLPSRAPAYLAEQFLHEHRDWLQQQLQRQPAAGRSPFSPAEDTQLLLRGQWLAIEHRPARLARIELADDRVLIELPANASEPRARALLRDFYARQARTDLGRWLPRYLPGLPRAPSAFRFRAMSSLWGSLAPNDAVSLDLSLVLGRPEAFEYVLVHELCHLLHRNHAPRYWREVEARFPDWRSQRDYLHGEGLALKAELRRFR